MDRLVQRGAIGRLCSSIEEQRTFCDAFTGGGVHLVRQISQARCEEGYGWGYDDRDIWVDQGCRAEFSLFEPRGNVYPNDGNRFTVIQSGTTMGASDIGVTRDGRHYHDYYDYDRRCRKGHRGPNSRR